MVGQELEETTLLGDSTKRKPPQKDPEISAEKKRKKKKKNKDTDCINDENAEQQQQQHSLLRKLGETELRDLSEKKKNERSEDEEVSDYLYQSSEEEFSDSLIYKSSEEEEENMSDASEYDELDYESCKAFGLLVEESIAEQEELDNGKRLASEAEGATYMRRPLGCENSGYEKSAEAEERYGQMICASEGFHVCDEATTGTGLVGHTHYVEIDDYLIDAAKFAVEQCNKKADREGKIRLKFERLLRATRQDQLYRLTLECTDGQFYEVKVWWSVFGRKKSKLYFLRRAKYYPVIMCCT